MTYRAKHPFDTSAVLCVALLGALGACSADENPAGEHPAASAPTDQRPVRLAVAEPPEASVPAPAADAPVQQPLSTSPPTTPIATLAAKAELHPVEGHEARGLVEFYLAQPVLAINVSLTGLKAGNHGFHVHTNGDCAGLKAAAAGSHLNPNATKHGDPNDADHRHHAGDLGNVRAEDDGTVKQWLRTEDLQLQGPAGIVGKALVVHAGEDDLESDPAGESGEPIACGVIRAIDW